MAERARHNLLFVVSCLERGGLELRLLELARSLPERFRLHVCVTSEELTLLEPFRQSAAGVVVVPVRRAYTEWGQLGRIRDYLARHDITVINTFDLKGLTLGCLLKLRSAGRLRLVHHTVDLLHSYGPRQKSLLKLLFRAVDRSLCNSAPAREALLDLGLGGRPIQVINNGVDTQRFRCDPARRSAMRAAHGLDQAETVLGTVANFRWEKNYPFLICAFRQLAQRHPNLRLLCVGGGPELERIKALARESGVDGRVIFTGYVDNVADYLQMMDLFALCSVKESFPNCMIQAMSCRLPVVVSDIGACAGLIEEGENGLKFRVNDSDQFLARLELLLGDPGLRAALGQKGQQTVTEKLSQEAMILNYTRFFDSVLCHGGVPGHD